MAGVYLLLIVPFACEYKFLALFFVSISPLVGILMQWLLETRRCIGMGLMSFFPVYRDYRSPYMDKVPWDFVGLPLPPKPLLFFCGGERAARARGASSRVDKRIC